MLYLFDPVIEEALSLSRSLCRIINRPHILFDESGLVEVQSIISGDTFMASMDELIEVVSADALFPSKINGGDQFYSDDDYDDDDDIFDDEDDEDLEDDDFLDDDEDEVFGDDADEDDEDIFEDFEENRFHHLYDYGDKLPVKAKYC